jgi:hypothetical protein
VTLIPIRVLLGAVSLGKERMPLTTGLYQILTFFLRQMHVARTRCGLLQLILEASESIFQLGQLVQHVKRAGATAMSLCMHEIIWVGQASELLCNSGTWANLEVQHPL